MSPKQKKHTKWLGILIAAALTIFVGIQATVAFLSTGTAPITNVFKPMVLSEGDFLLSKTLRYPLELNVDPDILKKLRFRFTLQFEADTATGSALFMSTDSGTGSSYLLQSATGSAYAGYKFATNYGTYTADENGAFTMTLAPGELAKIQGIAEGTTVTVTEHPVDWRPGFTVKDGVYTQAIVISADDSNTMQFVNEYAPTESAETDYTVAIDKTFTGRDLKDGEYFTFLLEYYDPDDKDAVDGWVPYSHTDVSAINKHGVDAVFDAYNGLSDFTFTKADQYAFRVSEMIPEDGKKMQDVTYDTGKYTFVVTVGDADMDGALEVQEILPGTDSQGKVTNKVTVDKTNKEIIVSFTNEYKPTGGGGGGGGEIIKPTAPEEHPDVPSALNGHDHMAYVFGYPDTTVQPNGKITRAEVAAIFYRLLEDDVRAKNKTNENPFNDVPKDAWYITDVSTIAAMDIIVGYPDGGFHPDAPITRAEFTALVSRFDKHDVPKEQIFSDIAGHWAEETILQAHQAGWIGGYEDGTFRPDHNITRAEAMAIVNRILHRQPECIDDLLEDMITWPDNADTNAWYYIDVQEATNGHDYEWKDDDKDHERWTKLDNEKEKESFLSRLLRLIRGDR